MYGDLDMDTVDTKRTEQAVGIVTEEEVGYLKNLYISQVLEGGSKKAANALVSYAHFLNREGINSDAYPLYLKILESNNRYAIDALLEGNNPEKYLDCVAPNHFLVESIFRILSKYKRNEIYSKTLRILFGFLIKVYSSPEEGYQLYQPTIANVNDLGKILNESKDQDDDLNRDILYILMFFADLDTHYTTDHRKKEIARQADRVRSDFFDNKRRLGQSLTEVLLEKSAKVNMGVAPAYVYVDG